MVSLRVKRHHSHGNSYKQIHFIGTALNVRVLLHYCHCRKHGGMQVDMMMVSSWESCIWIHRQQDEKERKPLELAWVSETSKPTPSDILPPKKLTCSKKAMPPNNATPWLLRFQLYEPMGYSHSNDHSWNPHTKESIWLSFFCAWVCRYLSLYLWMS